MSLLNWLRRKRQIDEDVAEEIRSHLALAARDRIAEGADAETARRAAIKEFGNVTRAIEDGRRVWSSWWIDAAGRPVQRRALRGTRSRQEPRVLGAALGIAVSYAVTRLLSSLLYGVSATDPASFLVALVVVLACAFGATLVPAWRAARTDPLAALRCQ